jgi:Lhr-like helicase
MPLSSRMAEEELRLRRTLRETFAAGGRAACEELLREVFRVPEPVAALAAGFVERQNEAAPVPVDSPVQVERVRRGRQQVILVHCVAGRAVNQSLAWVTAWRLARGESVVSNSNDHGFLLSLGAQVAVDEARLRGALAPGGFLNDLETVLRGTDTLGRKFRNVAETGQLIPKRSYKGPARAVAEARRLHAAPWEWFEHPRPSPFALPLFAAFNRDVLLAGDLHRAFDEMTAAVYAEWGPARAV